MTNNKINLNVATKVLEVVDAGLCRGKGVPIAGQMCVEAAVCFALGEPHGDNPSCVGSAVRAYKIPINDANWPCNKTRAEGMREVAVAQLGSDKLDQKDFSQRILVKTVQRILPIALRTAGSLIPKHKDALESAALVCEEAVDFVSAKAAAFSAKPVARAADAYAAAAADAYADAAVYAADAAVYAADAYAAAADAYAKKDRRVEILKLAATMCVEVLKEMGCEGTKWLFLCRK